MSGAITPANQPVTLPPRPAAGNSAAETARDFEAVFLGQVSQIMMETVENGTFSGGHAETMMRSIMAEHVGREMARRGGVGIAPVVLDQIIALQGGTSEGTAK